MMTPKGTSFNIFGCGCSTGCNQRDSYNTIDPDYGSRRSKNNVFKYEAQRDMDIPIYNWKDEVIVGNKNLRKPKSTLKQRNPS